MQQLVNEEKLRQDLVSRLRHAREPPLRDRREDIPLLVATFLAEERVTAGKLVSEVRRAALRRLASSDWPATCESCAPRASMP